MPELPEVETTRRGIAPAIDGRRIERVVVRQRALRWPVPRHLPRTLAGQAIHSVGRRGKYLLLRVDTGTLLIHLGMSGSLRIVPADEAPRPHDHVDLVLDDDRALRFHDPRRFGALLWTTADPLKHPRLRELGPEPLEDDFDGEHLFEQSRRRRVAVKQFLMDGRVVVGVGNIYANEALFLAGIRPGSAAGRLTRARCTALAGAVKTVLQDAIEQGGTTLRDFVGGTGEPGYFALKLNVYGRAGEPCRVCGAPIRGIRQGQRASYYCPRCQR